MTQLSPIELRFVEKAGWRDPICSDIAGDASTRRYKRIAVSAGQTAAILMIVPDPDQSQTERFEKVGSYLRRNGLSAPRIYDVDHQRGLMLIEDFGDDLFASLVDTDPTCEPALYINASDALHHLHQAPIPKGLPRFTVSEMVALCDLIWVHYTPDNLGMRDKFSTLLKSKLEEFVQSAPAVMLRDFHAGNLLWLPQRSGIERVGLLDFQDAYVGPRSYDLVSILQDARRDIPTEIETQVKRRFVEKSGMELDAFEVEYALIGAQRALRILAIFAKLCVVDGKPSYLEHMPRVWQQLTRNLSHPKLADLKEVLDQTIPEPTPEFIEGLRNQCPSL